MASHTRSLDGSPAEALPSRDSGARQQDLDIQSSSATPTLRLLQQELGADAHLLDRIPIHKVKMEEDVPLEQYLPQRILVGSVKAERGWCDAWAFLSTDVKRELDGVPHFTILSGPQWTKKYSIAHMNSVKFGNWVEVFKDFTDVRRSALIKTCFVLKGTQLPATTKFKEKLVGDIKAVCRSFDPENHTPTPMSPHGQPVVARKTQQRSPEGRLFSLLNTATPIFHSKRPMTPNITFAQRVADQAQSYPEDDRDTEGNNTNCENGHTITDLNFKDLKSSDSSTKPEAKTIQPASSMERLASNMPTSFSGQGVRPSVSISRRLSRRAALSDLIEREPIKPTMEQTPYLFISCHYLPILSKNISHLRQRLNAYQWDSVRCDQTGYFITFEESKKGEDEAVRCFQECNLQFLSGKYVMNMECSQHVKKTVAEVAPAVTHSDPLALLANHTSKHTLPKTRVLSPHLLATVTPPPENEVGEQLVADGIVLYQALIDKRQSLDNEIERIEFAAAETKKISKERREQMRHDIDVEMKVRHKEELQAAFDKLKEKHRAEEIAKKGAYKDLKAEAINHDQKIKEQLENARKRQKAVMQDLERQRNSLSREELLAFLERHTDNERAQKRRKVNNEGTHEE